MLAKTLGLKLKEEAMVLLSPSEINDTYLLHKVVSILPAGPRSLDESKGFAIADYQDVLEKRWVESLRKKYTVKINEKTVKSLIKN